MKQVRNLLQNFYWKSIAHNITHRCEDSLLYGERIRTSLDTVEILNVGSLLYRITALCHRTKTDLFLMLFYSFYQYNSFVLFCDFYFLVRTTR